MIEFPGFEPLPKTLRNISK